MMTKDEIKCINSNVWAVGYFLGMIYVLYHHEHFFGALFFLGMILNSLEVTVILHEIEKKENGDDK